MNNWVCCTSGQGYRHDENSISERLRSFKKNSVGLRERYFDNLPVVWLIGSDETWSVTGYVYEIEVKETGDKFEEKICNICHCLLPVEEFSLNQTNKHGPIRRPSCKRCRTDIDKRPPKTQQSKAMEKRRPKVGDKFRCPICEKRSIAGITAKVVADHDHHTGDIRDFICDSCNTGLGRFKNGKDYLQNAINYIQEREMNKLL